MVPCYIAAYRALTLDLPGGVGNTWNDPTAFDSLFRDVTTKLFDRLPDETIVHPGHGKPTSLGRERPSLPEWRRRGW